jgi:enamine deaminase RidA (YjgF/YER057c/UK114 family)
MPDWAGYCCVALVTSESKMTITRHEYPLKGEGRPIISRVVEYGDTVYVCGTLPDPVGDITTQTRQVLDRIDEALGLAGTSKSRLLTSQVWLADMTMFEAHNAVWNAWVDPDNAPVRVCVRADLVRNCLVEIMVTAAK